MINVEPMKVVVGQGAVIAQALEVLAPLSNRLTGFRLSRGEGGLEVSMSRLIAEIHTFSGEIFAKPVDISIGGCKSPMLIGRIESISDKYICICVVYAGMKGMAQPVHLISWGSAHLAAVGPVDMTLAVPADTLGMMGISGLPQDFAVPLQVKGSMYKPEVHVWR